MGLHLLAGQGALDLVFGLLLLAFDDRLEDQLGERLAGELLADDVEDLVVSQLLANGLQLV